MVLGSISAGVEAAGERRAGVFLLTGVLKAWAINTELDIS